MYETLYSVDRQSCKVNVKLEWSHYRPGVAQRMGRGIALLFHDRGTRRWRVVSSTPWPHFTPGKDPVPILQEAGWTPGPVWTAWKSRPHWDSIPNRPGRSSAAVPTELPGPPSCRVWFINTNSEWRTCVDSKAPVLDTVRFLQQLAIKSSTAYSNGLFQCQFEPNISKVIC